LLSDIPTFRELWEGAAVFFDPHNLEELGQSLRSLYGDEVRCARLQRAAADRARHYPLQNTASRYRELYESLLVTDGDRTRIEKGGVPA
jgi:glycosyltransferase involved in cell wall biosynthesis